MFTYICIDQSHTHAHTHHTNTHTHTHTHIYTHIESITRDHSACVLWSNLHNGRVTSSSFGKVIHHCDSTDNTSIIKQMMGYSHMSGLPAQLRWGLEKESVARNCYIKTMNSKGHREFRVMSSGLTLAKSFIPRGLC